jgi:hypothetical protein
MIVCLVGEVFGIGDDEEDRVKDTPLVVEDVLCKKGRREKRSYIGKRI